MPPRALFAIEPIGPLGDDSGKFSPLGISTGFDCNGDDRESEADLISSTVLLVAEEPVRVLPLEDTVLCIVWGDPYGKLACM